MNDYIFLHLFTDNDGSDDSEEIQALKQYIKQQLNNQNTRFVQLQQNLERIESLIVSNFLKSTETPKKTLRGQSEI